MMITTPRRSGVGATTGKLSLSPATGAGERGIPV